MSKSSMMQFAENMLSSSAFLRKHCHDIYDFTDPEYPLPTALLGSFGREIANNYDIITSCEWISLSRMIEDGLASDDDEVGTAVATGLIEGMIHRAEAIEDLWPRIEANLGPRARSYAEAYRRFGQEPVLQ